MTTNPRARELIAKASLLRSRKASLEQAKAEAQDLYPNSSNTDASHRTRLLQLFRASPEHFRLAANAAEDGANLVQVMSLVPARTRAGAPLHNTRAIGKRNPHSVVDRLSKLWKVADAKERAEFLKLHGIKPDRWQSV